MFIDGIAVLTGRARRRSALGLTALCCAAPSFGQDVVAEFSLEAPDSEEFILHGTLPLMPGTWRADDSGSPLTVLDVDGTPLVTQADKVSRFADPVLGVDVVELTARVHRPAGVPSGERIKYQVVQEYQGGGEPQLHPDVAEMLDLDGALELRSEDVFGHEYVADLGEALRNPGARRRRNGPLVRELTVHRVMMPESPVAGDQGTLPHLMGVHAWLRVFDREGYALLDLHVHNGLHGRDPSDPSDDLLDRVYFRHLALRVPQPWRVIHAFDSPVTGAGVPAGGMLDHMLVRPRGDNVYLMPRQSRMVRRLALALPGREEDARAALEERGLGFARRGHGQGEPLWSWWNRETARYFPQRHRLPELDHIGLEALRDELAAELASVETQVKTGAAGGYPFFSPLLGWAHPWGVAYGGMTGGDEIHPWSGLRTAATGSREGYRLAQLVTRTYSDRQPTALYAASGAHTRVDDLLEQGANGPYAFTGFYMTPWAGYGFEDAPDFQTKAVVAQGLEERWHDVLLDYAPIDMQHYIRFTRNLKVLTWLGNDSLARHLLLSAGEVYHLSFHRYPVGPYGWVPGAGLLAKQQLVANDPGEGIDLGRADAWGIDAAAAAYSVAGDGWRESKVDWFEAIERVVELGQSNCTGNLQAIHIGKVLGGRFLVRRANESGFLDHALVGMAESVFRGVHEGLAQNLDEVVIASARAGVKAPFWSPQDSAVYINVGVAPSDADLAEFCYDVPDSGYDGQLSGSHSWSSLAYAYQRTGDTFFLNRAKALAGGDLWNTLHDDGQYDLEKRAAILALIQSLGPQ